MSPSFAPAPSRRATGVRFRPVPFALAEFFLLRKILGLPLPERDVRERVDIYGADPDHLPIDINCGTEEWAYFFVEKKDDRRTTPGGYWNVAGDEEAVIGRDGRIIAFKNDFVFCRGSPPNGEETDWEMEEYRINPDLREIKNSSVPLRDYVAVKIYKEIPDPTLNPQNFETQSEESESSDEALQTSGDLTVTDQHRDVLGEKCNTIFSTLGQALLLILVFQLCIGR